MEKAFGGKTIVLEIRDLVKIYRTKGGESVLGVYDYFRGSFGFTNIGNGGARPISYFSNRFIEGFAQVDAGDTFWEERLLTGQALLSDGRFSVPDATPEDYAAALQTVDELIDACSGTAYAFDAQIGMSFDSPAGKELPELTIVGFYYGEYSYGQQRLLYVQAGL